MRSYLDAIARARAQERAEAFTRAKLRCRLGRACLPSPPQRTQMRESVRVTVRDEMPDARSPVQKPLAYLTREEVERFFRAIPRSKLRDRTLFDLIYRHGLRRGEAAQLTLDDVRGGKVWVARLKRGIPGAYPLHPRSNRLLSAYLPMRPIDGCPYLFRTRRRTGTPISGGEINRLFREYATAADLPASRCHVHVLRHSIGVHLMNAGWDIADVQDWLGHRDISSTMIYAQITNKRREARYKTTVRSREIARTEGGG
jgi:type 1 fimbriae regulatory protein FimB